MLRPPRRVLLAVLASLGALPPAALGAPLLTLDGAVEARARVAAGSIVDTDGNRLTGGVTGGPVHDARMAHADGTIGAAATVANGAFDGTAWFGELSGTASAQAIGGTGFGQVTLTWDDDFVATSSLLPSGTPVDYRFTMTLESAIFTNVSCSSTSPPGPATASLTANGGAAGIIVDRACPGPPADRTLSSILHTTVGAMMSIGGSLTLSASVGSSVSSLPDNQATVDASHTGRFFLDPLGPDYSYRTSSGVTYVSPIPEPGTLVLVASGLALAAIRRRVALRLAGGPRGGPPRI